jgi:hypothetical protein
LISYLGRIINYLTFLISTFKSVFMKRRSWFL